MLLVQGAEVAGNPQFRGPSAFRISANVLSWRIAHIGATFAAQPTCTLSIHGMPQMVLGYITKVNLDTLRKADTIVLEEIDRIPGHNT